MFVSTTKSGWFSDSLPSGIQYANLLDSNTVAYDSGDTALVYLVLLLADRVMVRTEKEDGGTSTIDLTMNPDDSQQAFDVLLRGARSD